MLVKPPFLASLRLEKLKLIRHCGKWFDSQPSYDVLDCRLVFELDVASKRFYSNTVNFLFCLCCLWYTKWTIRNVATISRLKLAEPAINNISRTFSSLGILFSSLWDYENFGNREIQNILWWEYNKAIWRLRGKSYRSAWLILIDNKMWSDYAT